MTKRVRDGGDGYCGVAGCLFDADSGADTRLRTRARGRVSVTARTEARGG